MKEVTNDVLTLALMTAPEELRVRIYKKHFPRARPK